MRWDDVARHIAIVRNAAADPEQRALSAATLAAADNGAEAPKDVDPALRMFGLLTRHPDAIAWDGRGSRSGTITFVDDERIEQYVGQGRWVTYRRADLPDAARVVGAQVRIGRRGDAIAIEGIGPNRLAQNAFGAGAEIRSGMFVLRTADSTLEEIESIVNVVAKRYGAVAKSDDDGIRMDFGAGARLEITPAEPAGFSRLAGLIGAPLASVVRLDAFVRSNKREAALEAERAIMLCAALLTVDQDTIAVDDSDAIFSADALYELATRNDMRADADSFAVAAVRRYDSTPHAPLAGRTHELSVFSARPWRADFAATFLARELRAMTQGAGDAGDPVVPVHWEIVAADRRGGEGTLERLAEITSDDGDAEVAFLDVATAHPELRSHVAGRRDIDALLGAPIASAVVIAYGARGAEPADVPVERELRRADALATALAAIVARRDNGIAIDAAGTVYSAAELCVLALRRCGTASSWNARVAAWRQWAAAESPAPATTRESSLISAPIQ